MEIIGKSASRLNELVSDWWLRSVGPWFSDQLSSMCDQIMALTVSAFVGGLITWISTRLSDKKARSREAKNRSEFREKLELRDKLRNLFEYRNWRATNPASAKNRWSVQIDTTSPHRDEWVLLAVPESGEGMHKIHFFIRSMHPIIQSTKLSSNFISTGGIYESAGMRWVKQNSKEGHWEIEPGESAIFSFNISEVIDNADFLTILFLNKKGVRILENHPISPFDSMKEYRPWEINKPNETE